MRRLLFALTPWMAMATAAWGQTRPAEIVYTHHGPLKTPAYRVLDECFVPIAGLETLGWKVRVREDYADIEAENTFVRAPIRIFDHVPTVGFRRIVESMGGESLWLNGHDKLRVVSLVKSVTIRGGRIRFEASMGVKPSASIIDSPNRLVIDLEGARLDRRAILELDPDARVGQFKPETVRIALNATLDAKILDRISKDPVLKFDFNPFAPEPVATPPVVATPVTDPGFDEGSGGGLRLEPEEPMMEPTPPATLTDGVVVRNVTPLFVEAENAKSLLLSLKLSGPLPRPATIQRLEATVLEIRLPGAAVEMNGGQPPNTASVREISSRQEGDVAVLRVVLARTMGAELVATASDVQIRFFKPNVGDGRLAGKIVVVDAGHGGHDGGAKGPGGTVKEKEMTLAISRLLSAKLTAEGATVIMTRNSDVFIPLPERAAIANRNNADFFLSVHINSSGKPNSSSGGMTFHHGGNQVGYLLAQSIQQEIAKVSKLPNLGVWSDKRIYDSGFSVLRNSTVPSVLIEMGFINNVNDRRRMVTAEFKQDVSAAIVRGLRIYLGDE